MTEFKAILHEGLFYLKDGALCIEQDDGKHLAVAAILAPLVGKHVQVALHYLPPNGIQPSEPGAGSCRFPEGKGCPVHHAQWDRMLSFSMEGVLDADPWRMQKFDGTVVPVPFEAMPGHFGRLAGATVLDLEGMRDALMNPAAVFAAQGIGGQELQELLARLRVRSTN